jgi:esterase/lipase superfamily enzyme
VNQDLDHSFDKKTIRLILHRVLLCGVLVVSGCGGHPKNVLTPVADTASQSHKVDMLIATTRSESTVPGEMFTGERARAPNFAEITVSVPPDSSLLISTRN